MDTYLEIGKKQLKYHSWLPILLCIIMLLCSPLVLGIRNLDALQTAKVLETYVALIGILLFPPVFLPEQNKDLRDLIASKYIRITYIYEIRIFISLAAALLLTAASLIVLKAGGCTMEPGTYFFGTIAEIIAFGGLGIFSYSLSDSQIIGYMAPLAYYAIAMGAGAAYLKKLYPFGMLSDFQTKYWLLAFGLVLMGIGVSLRKRR